MIEQKDNITTNITIQIGNVRINVSIPSKASVYDIANIFDDAALFMRRAETNITTLTEENQNDR